MVGQSWPYPAVSCLNRSSSRTDQYELESGVLGTTPPTRLKYLIISRLTVTVSLSILSCRSGDIVSLRFDFRETAASRGVFSIELWIV